MKNLLCNLVVPAVYQRSKLQAFSILRNSPLCWVSFCCLLLTLVAILLYHQQPTGFVGYRTAATAMNTLNNTKAKNGTRSTMSILFTVAFPEGDSNRCKTSRLHQVIMNSQYQTSLSCIPKRIVPSSSSFAQLLPPVKRDSIPSFVVYQNVLSTGGRSNGASW